MYRVIIAKIVIGFVLRQVDKFRESTDWEIVRADMHERVALLVPGEWFDDEAQKIADALLDGVKAVLAAQKDLGELLDALAEKRWEAAFAELRDLLLGAWDTEGDEHADQAKMLLL